MNDTVKAIETVYKGYRFRSRLEARWAVVFDRLELDWEYEPEGFDLGGNLGYYLPDFYIRDWDAWVEIKPKNTGQRSYNVAVSKLKRVCQHTDSIVGLLIAGGPEVDRGLESPPNYSITLAYYIHAGTYNNDESSKIPTYELMQGSMCESELWLRTKAKYETESQMIVGFCLNPTKLSDYRRPPIVGPRTQDALLAGQQARFEHGEAPVPPPSQIKSSFFSAQS